MRARRLTLDRLFFLGIAIMVIIVSAEFSAEFQLDFAVPQSPPPATGLSELLWIRNHFGYDNPDVITVVRDPSSYLWALAYVGGLVYFGNLLYLLANQTDYGVLNNKDPQVRSDYIGSLQRLWVYGALQKIDSGRYTVLVPFDLYHPDVLEAQALASSGAGVFQAKPVDQARILKLLDDWNLARSTNDILGVASHYIVVDPLANCSAYSGWVQSDWATSVTLVQNITNVSDCSLHIMTKVSKGATIYATLNGTWDISNETYIGFYFKGTTNSTGGYQLNILLSSATGYTSYYYYETTDTTLWDGRVQGIVLQLSQFQTIDSPHLTSISSVRFGIYSVDNAIFDYKLQYLVAAHNM